MAEPPGPLVDVVVEVPRWSFVKRGLGGRVDLLSPFPCPFNYGAVPTLIGLEGDLLDAVVLGPRLPRGVRVRVHALGAVGLADRGLYDDKLICGAAPLTPAQRRRIFRFFRFYAWCKRGLNLCRHRPGRTALVGWVDPATAIARAHRRGTDWSGPPVPF